VVREAHWKILGDVSDDSVALYNLSEDPGERRDVASLNRDMTSYLIGRHNEWIRATMKDAKAQGYGGP
jgi:hypothetical protein